MAHPGVREFFAEEARKRAGGTLVRAREMRIIYVTDIHDAFANLERLLQRTMADLYLIAGDLTYIIFPSYDKAWEFMGLQEYLLKIKKNEKAEGTLYGISRDILGTDNGGSEERRRSAVAYIRQSDEAQRRLRAKYDKLAGIFSRFSDRHIAAIPGNYDMDLRETSLKDWNLHLDSVEFDGLKISGYGGAPVQTPGVPDHIGVRFNEGYRDGEFFSEPYDYFKKERPDIAVTHQPPYGFMDTLAPKGHVGSIGIRNFIDERPPKIVFSGHIHEAWGCRYSGGVFFLNPSNFGRFVEVNRVKKGGYFFDLIVERGDLQVATLRKLEGERILDLADYMLRDGELRKLVLDERRISELSRQAPRESHIRSISRFRRLKQFFLSHENEASRRMIQDLRVIYRDIEKRGMHVAFDLLGSLNFGIAEPSSDVDLIVYLRGEECRPDPNDACSIPQPLQAVFDELRRRRMEIDVCDSLDLDRIERAIRAEDLEDSHLQRFAFYRSVCRPVNLRLIKEVENLFLDHPALRRKLETAVREYVRIMISSARHIYSFKKYQSRLMEKGIRMPEEIAEVLNKYLREA
ncbi:MAG: metallophosphoesterase [Deltaproteobacteria bacterium]|nr:metallophosphoesterase [Deltaproteobacteria bacterium]